MTKLTATHRLGQRAVFAVNSILDQVGALSEVIQNDYGEDLLVQTQLKDEADDFHVLIQVKGTHRLRNNRYGKSLQVGVNHLQRWVSFVNPVLICVFEEATGAIYAVSPRDRFSLWKLSTTNQKTLSIRFDEIDRFDKNRASNFIWKCRIEHYSRSISWLENSIHYHENMIPKRAMRDLNSEISIIVFGFLRAVGLMPGDFLPEDFRKKIRNCSRNFEKKNKDEQSDQLGLRDAIMLSLLGHVDEIAHQGLPSNLLENGTELCGMFFMRFHPGEWRTAVKCFPGETWIPYRREPR
jgi:hypothetical protein